MLHKNVLEILGAEGLKKSGRDFSNSRVLKAFSQSSDPRLGPQPYDLSPGAAELYPLLTPLRNTIARRTGFSGAVTNWKTWRAVNNGRGRAVVGEGQRAAFGTQTLEDRFAPYRTLGAEDNVTFEAENAGGTQFDLKARAALQALQNLMLAEEVCILGGNTSLPLGVTPTPTLTTATTGGSIAAGTYSVVAVALGFAAYWDLAGLNNGATGQSFVATTSLGLQGLISRTNADGSTLSVPGGHAQPSASATQATTGATSVINAAVSLVRGAYGYAWYVGAAGSERLAAVSSINSVALTSIPATGQLLSAIPGGVSADRSASPLEYDGILTTTLSSNSGAVVQSMATGTPGVGVGLTSDGGGGIVEFNAMLAQIYDLYRHSPTAIYVSARDLQNVTRRILNGVSSPVITLTANVNETTGRLEVVGGNRAAFYLNAPANSSVPIVVHPNMPAGTVLFDTDKYNGTEVRDIAVRDDYLAIDWPITTRRNDYGVYVDAALRISAPWACGVINNIANL